MRAPAGMAVPATRGTLASRPRTATTGSRAWRRRPARRAAHHPAPAAAAQQQRRQRQQLADCWRAAVLAAPACTQPATRTSSAWSCSCVAASTSASGGLAWHSCSASRHSCAASLSACRAALCTGHSEQRGGRRRSSRACPSLQARAACISCCCCCCCTGAHQAGCCVIIQLILVVRHGLVQLGQRSIHLRQAPTSRGGERHAKPGGDCGTGVRNARPPGVPRPLQKPPARPWSFPASP